ncbi:unnamed protein product [Adineta ricciae]|uniref:G-protein coupled receptors family 1 profile domain-containing protein n=1 Tax=Adineta ricciae TaxID=249248 RepID=A0A814F800_ADIRI|nr:unnamed protein product [Adineta ricciae]CAF1363924.1 unnamed protein product [Adineta ricciae]
MSNSIDSVIENINLTIIWINHIAPILQIVFGTCGNIFNIIVFTRSTLRSNPCSMYFLAASISNLFEIYVAILHQYLSNTWNWDYATINNPLCILRNWVANPVFCLVLWFIVLASFDRYLLSSHDARIRVREGVGVGRSFRQLDPLKPESVPVQLFSIPAGIAQEISDQFLTVSSSKFAGNGREITGTYVSTSGRNPVARKWSENEPNRPESTVP